MTRVTLMSLALSVLFLTHGAYASFSPYFGTYAYPHQVAMFNYEDEESCVADSGEWDSESEMCFISTEDSVSITSDPSDELKIWLQVSTIATNAHTCNFSEQAVEESPGVFKSVVDTFDYIYNEETKEFDSVPAKCTVVAEVSEVLEISEPARIVTVTSSGACRDFCGMRATLDTEARFKEAYEAPEQQVHKVSSSPVFPIVRVADKACTMDAKYRNRY